METMELVKALMKASKSIMPGGKGPGGPGAPGGPQGGPPKPPTGGPQGGPPMPPAGGPQGGPPLDKKLMTLLSVTMPAQKVSTLSKIMGMGPDTHKITETAKELEAQGYVIVEDVTGGAEKPEYLLTMTEAGRAKLQADKEAFEHRFDSKFEDLSDEEKETLVKLLGKIKA